MMSSLLMRFLSVIVLGGDIDKYLNYMQYLLRNSVTLLI